MPTALLLVPLLLAGCASNDGNGPPPPQASRVDAPWWPVGAWWDIRFEHRGAPAQTVRLTNFLNESDHFWLGVESREAALDHALHDTNPFLGRVHWNLLAPHEGSRHAIMYKFPLKDGEQFTSGNPFFGSDWNLVSRNDGGRYRFVGTAADEATIAFDYDPRTMWFRDLEVREPDGRPRLVATVVDSGTGSTGAWWFLRGRDYYEGPSGSGTHTETFEVPEEERPLTSLVVEVDATFSGPMRIDILDPAGTTRHTETSTGGALRNTIEIPMPQMGTWSVRYIGTGNVDGVIDVTGMLGYTESL